MGRAAVLAAARAMTKEEALELSRNAELHGATQALSARHIVHSQSPRHAATEPPVRRKSFGRPYPRAEPRSNPAASRTLATPDRNFVSGNPNAGNGQPQDHVSRPGGQSRRCRTRFHRLWPAILQRRPIPEFRPACVSANCRCARMCSWVWRRKKGVLAAVTGRAWPSCARSGRLNGRTSSRVAHDMPAPKLAGASASLRRRLPGKFHASLR